MGRTVSATVYPGEKKDALLRAIAKGRTYEVIVQDPLALGTGPFDIQDLDGTFRLRVTDRAREWFVFVERAGDALVAHEHE